MRRSASLLLAGIAIAGVACQDATEPATDAPDFSQSATQATTERHIVVFNRDVADPPGLARGLTQAHGGTLLFTYQHAIKGFAARLPSHAVDALSRNPNVAYVEPDREAQLHDVQPNPPSWGLDRIDARDGLDNSFTFGATGADVNVYIFDTGINSSHSDFGTRASPVSGGNNGDFVGDTWGNANGAEDCHGHGSHVAGTAAGASFGVAKDATIWAARVVNCNGSGNVSMAIAAVDWATANAQTPAVVNMSLGYGNVEALRQAVENSVAAGINYSVSAGNGNLAGIPQDACNGSPAGAPSALTVGATASDDDEASFSNYGSCVDLLAPGVAITSAWIGGSSASATISGTSMSAPHVTGAVALFLEANAGATPADVASALTSNATQNAIRLHRRSSRGGTANLLLYTAFIGGGGEPPGNNPPTASFNDDCADLTCSYTDQSTDSDGTIVAWSWDFGDGNTATAQSPEHTYGAADTYTVTLTVTDDDGATDAASKNVSVGGACIPRGKSGKCK
jgi:subtilisin family serine protease